MKTVRNNAKFRREGVLDNLIIHMHLVEVRLGGQLS